MVLLPFDVADSRNVLVAGAGGGFDFLCGLPIALELELKNVRCHLASYSFTDLRAVLNASGNAECLLEIDGDSNLARGDYFPERLLAQWFRDRKGVRRPIWCLPKRGVAPTLSAYDELIDRFQIDTVICVDGGLDGIVRGDEFDLGTPAMDSISVVAASRCKAKRKIYACTAFGAEGAEGRFSHAHVLRRMADLVRQGAMLGVGALLKSTTTGVAFDEAVSWIETRLPPLQRSIIVGSIRAAMNGACGSTVVHEKTRERPPWISPLALLFWYFEAEPVARMKKYYDNILFSNTVEEVVHAIRVHRDRGPVAPYEPIPI